MTLRISISTEAESRLRELAAAAGVSPDRLAAALVERGVGAAPELAGISGPLADEFSRSGMSDDELADLLEREKHLMRAERRASQS